MTNMTQKEMTDAIKRQASTIDASDIGTVNIFGEAVTPSDIAHQLNELARVANLYASKFKS